MDRMEVSGTSDTGSIPVGATKARLTFLIISPLLFGRLHWGLIWGLGGKKNAPRCYSRGVCLFTF